MSVPHTGKLVAVVNGVTCHFDGDRWTTPDAALTALLNAETGQSPKTHFDIRSLALQVLSRAGLESRSRILSAQGDAWRDNFTEADGVDCAPEMTESQFYSLARRIERLGFDPETAARYAALIGDTPCQDEHGLTVVEDEQGRELARLALEL